MDDKSRDKWVFTRFAGCSFLVVLYFVAFIIAFALIDKGGETQLCGGRITITETSSQPKTLAIVYQAIFAGLCLLLGLSIAYTGGSLYHQIQEAEQVKQSHNSSNELGAKVFWLTMIITISFIVHTVWIIVNASTTINIFVSLSILMLIELPPCFLLAYFQLGKLFSFVARTASTVSAGTTKTSSFSRQSSASATTG
eukprot:TRINITY_DN962_c0_g1_i1.p1 TRINITY_DN962_c0_g1~~TRINITY_DN962_c0_g1_i1.p1  ORF type:complete len:205 (-),score=68.79 TRINITY_DN962_c0_g1_i1:61-651(-)